MLTSCVHSHAFCPTVLIAWNTVNLLSHPLMISAKSSVSLSPKVNWCTNKSSVRDPSTNTCPDSSVGKKAWDTRSDHYFRESSIVKVHFHYTFLFEIWRKCKEWVIYPFFAFDATSHRHNVAIWRKDRRRCNRTHIVWMDLKNTDVLNL